MNKTVNAIAGKNQRGVKPLDNLLNEVDRAYLKISGIEKIKVLKKQPTYEELLQENRLLKKQLHKFGIIFDNFANKKLAEEINQEIKEEKGKEVEFPKEEL